MGPHVALQVESTFHIYMVWICYPLVILILKCTRSSALIPKPKDWGPHINITGFSFLKAAPNYQPPEDLVKFLQAGPPPIYIGFGSIVVENPGELTKLIFGAVKRAGVRALVSKGWGGLGEGQAPEGIFLLGNCPHDWLFQYVSCVVHHGGAGTSAIGIAMGKPTIVVPFFGDQPFWGAMIYRAGAGPEPVPYKSLTEENLAESITRALESDIQASVKEMSQKIASENGCEAAAASFNHSINYNRMRCPICPDQVAVWRIKNTNLRLSTLAIATLADNGLLGLSDLSLYVLCRPLISPSCTDNSRNRLQDWYIDEGATSAIAGFLASISDMVIKTWASTSTYLKDLSATLHSKPDLNHTQSIDLEQQISEPEMGILIGEIPPNPVQAAMAYPPQHLERVAYRMASETLPDTKNRSRHRKMHPWSPRMQVSYVSKLGSRRKKTKKKHGKAYEITIETGQFIYSLTRTGLHGMYLFEMVR